LKKKYKILIVGGTGFIGYHLAKNLRKKYIVTSLSTKKPKKIRFLKNIKYLTCDISNKSMLKKKLSDEYHYIVNLGGYVDHSNKSKTYKSHYIGCKNLVNIFLRKKYLKKFIQVGSSLEYGSQKSPQKESLSGNSKSNYSKSKSLASKYLLKTFKKHAFPVTIIRLYQIFGPKQDINRFLPIIICSCLKNKRFPCSNGKQYRDFLSVKDLVLAIKKILNNSKTNGEILNIGSGKPEKIKKIITYIKNKIKRGNPQFGKIKLRKDESIKTFPSIDKAKKMIKWSPKFNFYNQIDKLIIYYKKNLIFHT